MLALLGVATRVTPFVQMALINGWAAIVLVLAAAQLTHRAFGRAAAMWVGPIVVLGLDPLGWTFVALRVWRGQAGGLGATLAEFGTGSGAAGMLAYRFPPAHVSQLGPLWTGSPLMPALALCVATAWSAARAIDRPSRTASTRTLALALAALALHPACAAIALVALAVGLVRAAAARERRGPAIALLALLALAILGAILYVRSFAVPGAMQWPGAGLLRDNLWSLELAVGPWWLVAVAAFGLVKGGRWASVLCATTAAITTIAALTLVRSPAGSNALFFLAWVSLAPLIAAGWAWWADRLRLPALARLILLVILIGPTTLLFTLGTAIDPRSPGEVIHGAPDSHRRRPLATPGEEEAYRWMQEVLPEEAVVIEKQRPTANEPVPVLGARRVFCGSLDVRLADQLGGRTRSREALALFEEFTVRRGIQDALFECGMLDETQRQYLATFSRPIYLVVRRSELPDAVWYGFGSQPFWNEGFANREIRVYVFDSSRALPGAG